MSHISKKNRGTRKALRSTRRSSELLIVQQNMRNMKKDFSDLDVLINYVSNKNNSNIIFLNECCIPGNVQRNIRGSEVFIYGEKNDIHSGGVGISLSGKALSAWKNAGSLPPVHEFILINGKPSGRIIGLHLNFCIGKHKIKKFVISTYLPCANHNDDTYEETLEKLSHFIDKHTKNSRPIIGGDFNARIGTRISYDTDESLKKFIGPYGNQDNNTRGHSVLSFLQRNQLHNPATFFKKQDYTTWSNKITKTKAVTNINHTIDYIFLHTDEKKFIRNCQTDNPLLGLSTDHSCVCIDYKLPFESLTSNNIQLKNKKNEKNIRRNTDISDAQKEKFNDEMKSILQEKTNISAGELSKALKFVASETLPILEKNQNDWYKQDEDNLSKLIKLKRNAEKTKNKSNCKETRKNLKKAIKEAKNKWILSKIETLENIDHNPFDAWKALEMLQKGISHHHSDSSSKYVKLRKEDGTLTDIPKEQVQIHANFFGKEIFGRQASYDQRSIDDLPQHFINTSIDNPIDENELNNALKHAKNRKAPGLNGIPVEYYKLLDEDNRKPILKILNAYFLQPSYDIPDWHNVTLKLLPKKGDLSLPKNYRPISLLDVLSKILSYILTQRINTHLTEIGLKEQAGFMQNRGCSDATSTLKITLQNLKASNHDSFVLFVDIVKAFDSVNREMLWQILKKYGIPPIAIKCIEKMYTNIQIHLNIGTAQTSFKSTSGVKQGDNLAPVLFLFVIQAAIDTMHKHWPTTLPPLQWFPTSKSFLNKRSQNKNSHTLDHKDTFYADDSAFIFLSEEDLIKGTEFVNNTFQSFGLQVHLGDKATNTKSKTEAMYFPSDPNIPITDHLKSGNYDVGKENKHFVSYTTNFKYLGTHLSQDLSDDFDIDQRLIAATRHFNAHGRRIFRDRKIQLHYRTRLYVATTLNILLWGCDSWALKHEHIRKLNVFHNKCIRSMIGIDMHCVRNKKSGTRNSEILKKSMLHPIETYITIRQLRFLQRVSRMDQDRLTYQIMSSQGIKKENSGRCKYQTSTKSAYKDALIRANLFEKGSDIETEKWMEMMRRRDVGSRIEENLNLEPGKFSRRKRNQTTTHNNCSY